MFFPSELFHLLYCLFGSGITYFKCVFFKFMREVFLSFSRGLHDMLQLDLFICLSVCLQELSACHVVYCLGRTSNLLCKLELE